MESAFNGIKELEEMIAKAQEAHKGFLRTARAMGPLPTRTDKEQIELLKEQINSKYYTVFMQLEMDHKSFTQLIKTEFERKIKDAETYINDKEILEDKLEDLRSELEISLHEEKMRFEYLKSIVDRKIIVEINEMKKSYRHKALMNQK